MADEADEFQTQDWNWFQEDAELDAQRKLAKTRLLSDLSEEMNDFEASVMQQRQSVLASVQPPQRPVIQSEYSAFDPVPFRPIPIDEDLPPPPVSLAMHDQTNCDAYDDMWGYYYEPFGGVVWFEDPPHPGEYPGSPEFPFQWWKPWCRRNIEFIYDPTVPEVREFQAYLVGTFDEHFLNNPDAFWFEPTPDAIEDLLDNEFALDAPRGVPLKLTIWMQMMRYMAKQYDSETGRPGGHDIDTTGNDAGSIPFIYGICYHTDLAFTYYNP